MPSTYAHYVFGKKMLERFPLSLAETARNRRELYDIGLHGPDILFYYHPLTTNKVNSVGFGTHERPAREFFARAKEACLYSEDPAGATAYALGFVCHFALDTECHSYIENKIAVSDVRHTEIESEFDRNLLEKQGIEPLSAKLTEHIAASARNADTIAPFFEGITGKQVLKSLRSMCRYNELLRAPHALKRFAVETILHLSGNYREMHGMMMAKKPIAACRDSNLRLEKLMRKAEDLCVRLAENFMGYLEGKTELCDTFDRTFGPNGNWREIPVLSEKEEHNYEV